MKRLIVKIGCYWCIISIFCVICGIRNMTSGLVFIFAISLGLVNTLVRPILLTVSLIFNMLTFGIVSILVNWLTLWLASLIVAYWWRVGAFRMLLLAISIMLVDDVVARMRYRLVKNRV